MDSDWKEYHLGDVTDWSSGGTPSKNKDEYWNGDIPWISASSMHNNRFEKSELNITTAGLKAGSKLAKKGSLLLLVRGSTLHQRIPVGMAMRDVAFNQDVKMIKARTQFLEDWYLLFWFMSQEKELLNLVENTGIGAGKLDTKQLKNLIIKIPPKDKRKKIIKQLGAIDDKIILNRRLNQTLEQLFQAIFKSWFIDFEPVKAKGHLRKLGGDSVQIERAVQAIISGAVNLEEIIAGSDLTDLDNEIKSRLEAKLGCQTKEQQCNLAETAKFFPDKLIESELGIIPEGWKSTVLSEIIELKYGKALKKNDREKGAYPVYGSGGIVGSHKKYLVKGPGVIVARKGSVGNLFWTENNFFPIDTTFFVSPVSKIPLFWVYMKLRTIDILSLSSDSAVPGVNRNALLSQKIVLPNLILLEKFMNYITPFVKLKNANQNEIESLSSLRDELLPRLLSGKMDISEK